MKCIVLFVSLIALASAVDIDASASSNIGSTASAESSQQLVGAASSLDPFHDKKQEKRYIPYSGAGGYGGYGGYGGGYGGYGSGYGGYAGGIDSSLGYQSGAYNPYSSRVLGGLDSYSGGYNGYSSPYAGYGGYSGYGGYNSNPYYNSYYSSRLGGYPYQRPSYGYNSYPSSYYSSNYANSIVGGGLGGLGAAGIVPPVPIGGALGAGYQYGPGISGSIY